MPLWIPAFAGMTGWAYPARFTLFARALSSDFFGLGERAGLPLVPPDGGKPWWTVLLDIRLCRYNESFGVISESERR